MKYIFDFDGVIFDAERFKEKILFTALVSFGISKLLAKELYIKEGFIDLHIFLIKLLQKNNIHVNKDDIDKIEENIFNSCSKLLKPKTISFIQKKKKEDCYILSFGDASFQQKKIEKSGIEKFVAQVKIVSGSKKEWVIAFAKKYSHETVYFIDDNAEHISHTEFASISNLKTVLYTREGSLKELE